MKMTDPRCALFGQGGHVTNCGCWSTFSEPLERAITEILEKGVCSCKPYHGPWSWPGDMELTPGCPTHDGPPNLGLDVPNVEPSSG